MQPERFRFGLFEFSAAAHELRREGVLVRLQAQPAEVLACLIDHAGQVVSRDDLRSALWGEDTFVDFDRGLNFCISQIRSALHDDSAEPIYIRTIPKHGYQFIAPVEQVFAHALDNPKRDDQQRTQPKVPAVPPIAVASPRVRSRTLALACGGLVLGMLVLAASYRVLKPPMPPHSPIVAVLRFDNETGNPKMDQFSDALTDAVVEQLTAQSGGQYQVIGNALILRGSREHRDLKAIAAALHANCVVLGQVQANGSQVRILAHLIRLPDQIHLAVVRTERILDDPLAVQSSVAQKVSSEFSTRVSELSARTASPAPASH